VNWTTTYIIFQNTLLILHIFFAYSFSLIRFFHVFNFYSAAKINFINLKIMISASAPCWCYCTQHRVHIKVARISYTYNNNNKVVKIYVINMYIYCYSLFYSWVGGKIISDEWTYYDRSWELNIICTWHIVYLNPFTFWFLEQLSV